MQTLVAEAKVNIFALKPHNKFQHKLIKNKLFS